MGIGVGTIIAAASLATTAAAGYMQYQAASDAADAREEAGKISGAQQQIQQRRGTRQAIREERIRRARIMQAAESTGVGGSSGQFGSTAALSTLTGTNVANQRGQAAAARGIGAANQRAADAQSTGQMWGAIGQVSGSVFSAAGGFGEQGVGSLWPKGNGSGSPIQGGFQNEIWTP
tara:strand:+ start:17081 stop:17608 length:528 start_codon:yes stop_codon:yes gene_type:complete